MTAGPAAPVSCSSCGQALRPGATFCTRCGARAGDRSEARRLPGPPPGGFPGPGGPAGSTDARTTPDPFPTTPERSPWYSRPPVALAAVAVALLAVGGAYLALRGPSSAATPPAAVASSSTVTATACPTEAAATMPAAASGAPLIARDARVHIAVCEGGSGQLYYYGADDRTHLTITLPATRVADGFRATNGAVTYAISPQHLTVARPGRILEDHDLSTGWSR